MPTTCRKGRPASPLRKIDIDRLREVLDYDAKSGLFYWKVRLADCIHVGDEAGCEVTLAKGKKYIWIRFDGVLHQAHRLAWAHHYGEQPPRRIDHEDGDGCHNWIGNLRKATQSQNCANMRKTIRSATGLRGVYPYGTTGRRFEAKAMKDYKPVRFGVFDNPEEAYAAYCVGMKTLFGEFASVV